MKKQLFNLCWVRLVQLVLHQKKEQVSEEEEKQHHKHQHQHLQNRDLEWLVHGDE